MTDKWQGGHTYIPGSLVIPASAAPVTTAQPVNPVFATGTLSGWSTTDTARWTVSSVTPYKGTYAVVCSGSAGLTKLDCVTQGDVKPGGSVTVSAKFKITNAGTDDAVAQSVLVWVNSIGGVISFVAGNPIQGKGGFYAISQAAGSAPAGAVKFYLSLSVNPGTHGSTVEADDAAYLYNYQAPTAGIIYKATQAAPAKSASTEPAWPGTVGGTVVDGGVTWQGELATRIVWQASPLLKSSVTEPVWPLGDGAVVHDGTIDWIARSTRVTDLNCPKSAIVQIAAGKVYAADNDVIRYSATVDPTNWTAVSDAGFLPFGLQTYGSNPVAAMGLYRGNLVAFNAEGFQMWQVDPDPSLSALLSALPIASTQNKAVAPVANDLLFLSSRGVRSVGISATSDSLEGGDVGMPIDVLVQDAMATAKANGTLPLATYIPSAGQYFLAFNKPGTI